MNKFSVKNNKNKEPYNAWGEILSITDGEDVLITDWYHIAHLNPLRYRGYYYDTETGFYYLQSRYYDPALHRFINADSAEYSAMTALSINGTNLFAYCQNNPVAYADDNGEWLHVLIGAVVGAVVNTVVAVAEGKPVDEVIVSAVCGAVSGGLAATGVGGIVGQMVAGAVTSGIDSGYENVKDVIQGNKSIGEAVVNTLVNAGMGTLTGAMGFEGKVPLNAPLKKVWWKCVEEEMVVSALTTAISLGTSKVSEVAYKYYEGLLK